MTNTVMTRVPLLVGAVVACPLVLTPRVTHAQEAPAVIHACYIPTTGLIYRIKAEGLPDTCRAAEHVAFHWAVSTEGKPTPVPRPAAAQGEVAEEPGATPSTEIAVGTSSALAGSRMLWLPDKAAFRAGGVTATEWDDASVGEYSVAMGRSTTASGDYSTALGAGTRASGPISTALGVATTASGRYATAMGRYTRAQAYVSTVLGRYNVVSGTTDIWYPTEPLLVVGNGTRSAPANALTLLKNGDLTVAGVVESEAGGFKFPDATVQTTAASLAAIAFADLGSGVEVPVSPRNLGSVSITAPTSGKVLLILSGSSVIFGDNTELVVGLGSSPGAVDLHEIRVGRLDGVGSQRFEYAFNPTAVVNVVSGTRTFYATAFKPSTFSSKTVIVDGLHLVAVFIPD